MNEIVLFLLATCLFLVVVALFMVIIARAHEWLAINIGLYENFSHWLRFSGHRR